MFNHLALHIAEGKLVKGGTILMIMVNGQIILWRKKNKREKIYKSIGKQRENLIKNEKIV